MDQKKAAMYAAICGVVVFVGVLLPWYSWSLDVSGSPLGGMMPRTGTTSFNGTKGDFLGTWTLIFGLVSAAAAGLLWKGKAQGLPLNPKQLSLVALGGLGLGAVLTLIDLTSHGGSSFNEGGAFGISASGGKGIGIYLTLAACIAGAYCAWVLFQKTPGSASSPPPAAPPPA